ncbi:hypothetical protein ACFU7D_24255 [Nocardioides sp. NPDC057577]|uniref:hypothetical protein n=1 Tax=Nocardioides sp. NPDC057577 TaxID=3346171 RepID=UPI00366CF730
MGLAQLIQVEDARERTFDWSTIAEGWRVHPPEDYVQFMREVGPGEFGGYLDVMAPTDNLDAGRGIDPGTLAGMDVFAMATETQDAQHDWDDPTIPRDYQIASMSTRLMCWAVSTDANRYCFDLSDSAWPIFVYDRGFDMWSAYDLSFTEFVAGLIQDSIPNYAGYRVASHLGWEIPVTYKVHERDRS